MSHRKNDLCPVSAHACGLQVVQPNKRDEAQIAPEAGVPKMAIRKGFFGRRRSRQSKNEAILNEIRQFMPHLSAGRPKFRAPDLA
jgi:hypothetical protein